MQGNLKKDKPSIERREKILEELYRQGHVLTNSLSEKYRVSEVTIRNDLIYFEKKGMLFRTRGGAIQNQRVSIDSDLREKSRRHLSDKQKIAKKARQLIEDGDTIILDSGTTTQEIAKNLGDVNDLTVITNAINVAAELGNYRHIKVIMLGGILRKNSLSFVGCMAEEALRKYYCDKVFMGVDGIFSEYGITTPNIEEAHLNVIMIEISRELIVVTDSSKFLKKSFAFISPVSRINTLITDSNIPDTEYSSIANMGVNILTI
jgi:DeoR family transcriptional regulator of aga operon